MFPIKVNNKQQSPSCSIHHHLHLTKAEKKSFKNLVVRRGFRSRRKSNHMTTQSAGEARHGAQRGTNLPERKRTNKQTLAVARKSGSRQRNYSHSPPKLGENVVDSAARHTRSDATRRDVTRGDREERVAWRSPPWRRRSRSWRERRPWGGGHRFVTRYGRRSEGCGNTTSRTMDPR